MTSFFDLSAFKVRGCLPKAFLIKYKSLSITFSGLKLTLETLKKDVVCFVYEVEVSYDFFFLKTAKLGTRITPISNCSATKRQIMYELEESRNVLIIQLILACLLFYKGIMIWVDLIHIIEGINLKIRNRVPRAKKIKSPKLDFNFYRFLLSRDIESCIIKKNDLRFFSTLKICFKLIRPLYYVSMVGYLLQIYAAVYSLYGVYFMDVVAPCHTGLAGPVKPYWNRHPL